MKLAVISFTHKGSQCNERLVKVLKESGYEAAGYGISRFVKGTSLTGFDSLSLLTGQLFRESAGILFIGACGIAVRAIAPYIKSKASDPAVLVIDEGGRFVISLLSGHLGGANRLAKEVAGFLNAVPVITTATDLNEKFAVDNWAAGNHLAIEDISMIKVISGTILEGKKVGIYSEYPMEGTLPEELVLSDAFGLKAAGRLKRQKVIHSDFEAGICIAGNSDIRPFLKTLNLLPQTIVIGMGCKKGTDYEKLLSVLETMLSKRNISRKRICKLCSIDLKKGEEGLVKLAETLKVPFITYTAGELKEVKGEFTPSAFVKSVTGVDNVCERSAVLGSGYGKRILSKTGMDGITIAICETDFKVILGNCETI